MMNNMVQIVLFEHHRLKRWHHICELSWQTVNVSYHQSLLAQRWRIATAGA